MHMVSFSPDGAVQLKVNLCSCIYCIEGQFMKCCAEKGILFCDSESCGVTDSDTAKGMKKRKTKILIQTRNLKNLKLEETLSFML